MLKIDVSKYNSLEHALKMLKKKVRNTKVMETIRENRYFTKPSVTKRKKMIKARHMNKKSLE
jgi:small subunit ribosomal protein S21